MITITVWKADSQYRGFSFDGHADYASCGEDIVCAAVSVLALNTANSIEALTDQIFEQEIASDGGYLKMIFPEGANEKTSLLMDSLVLGLKSIQEEYGYDYVNLTVKEV
ncbi:MAG: ribosomal-processing cysteine protease Prp [Lachnospiraceae bacterium]|nr:ribosomal-processing cysteine protease Prp [Lachnospiraceae bacterium]